MAVVALVAVGAAAVYWGPGLLEKSTASPPTELCTVTQGEAQYWLTAEQANNAALIAAVGTSKGFEVGGITVALATAIQESSLRNLDYGDRDSIGLFQQRPSQGWGTVAQIADPYYSTETFYAALLTVNGWESMAVTDAAQAVQRSGFPFAYADHEREARAWATAFTGGAAQVVCDLGEPAPADAQAFAARVAADFGPGTHAVDVIEAGDDVIMVAVRPGTGVRDAALPAPPGAQPGTGTQAELRLLAWSIATASDTGAAVATIDGEGWVRDGSSIAAMLIPEVAAFDGVHVTLGPADY